MGDFYILEGLTVSIDMDSVMLSIDCKKDSPIYEEMVDEYEELWPEMIKLAEPVGILGFGILPDLGPECAYPAGTKVIYAVTSIGDGIKQCSSRGFAEGDYVRGMLCDAIADAALFSMEDQVQERLKAVCKEHGVGIERRMEAPYDMPMEVQRAAWEHLDLKGRFGIDISSGYMFDPVKTSCQVYILTEDSNIFKAQHDCANCPNVKCKMRKVPGAKITVQRGTETKMLQLGSGESLMDGLLREGYYISAVCGGKGRCGKCKVRVLAGTAAVTDEDGKVFSEQELAEGWRLSCMQYPADDLTIAFELDDEAEFEAVSSHDSYSFDGMSKPSGKMELSEEVRVSGHTTEKDSAESSAENTTKTGSYEIAIDIGTTTIAFELLEKESGKPIHTVTTVNSQRRYGADVIARIQASVDGKAKELQECIRGDLRKGIEALLETVQPQVNQAIENSEDANLINADQISRIIISGNTTMGHLLLGYDCSGLGVYPFTPVDIGFISGSVREILGIPGISTCSDVRKEHGLDDSVCSDAGSVQGLDVTACRDTEVMLLPGISTYVGADITSGMYVCGFDENEEICLLVDLGTNGEMALGNKDRILVTSTAAGPAFEGGNIKWGMGSVAGAICSVKLDGTNVQVQTIRDRKPVGICGTGVLETVAELLREELVDETGLLDDDYFDDGFPLAVTPQGEQIVFTQKDVREIQLAKAAVRAGVETLILRYGIEKEQVAKVYLAGGFGYRLDTEKAIAIGMLPEEFAGRITAVGNSSLAGAAKYLKEADGAAKLQKLVQISEEIGLSADKDFNEFYMESMMFE